MAHLAEVVTVEADDIALLQAVDAGDLFPIVHAGIARGVEPAAVAARFLEAVIYKTAAVKLLGAFRAQHVFAAQLALGYLYHLADVGLGAGLLRLGFAFLGLGRIQHLVGLFSRQSVGAEAVAALEFLHGGLGLVAVIAGGLAHVAHIHQLLLHGGYVVAAHAFLYAVAGSIIAVQQRQGQVSRPAVLINGNAQGIGKVYLTLEQLHAVLGCGAKKVGCCVRIHIAQLHQSGLQLMVALALHAPMEYRLRSGGGGRLGCGGRSYFYCNNAAAGFIYLCGSHIHRLLLAAAAE